MHRKKEQLRTIYRSCFFRMYQIEILHYLRRIQFALTTVESALVDSQILLQLD